MIVLIGGGLFNLLDADDDRAGRPDQCHRAPAHPPRPRRRPRCPIASMSPSAARLNAYRTPPRGLGSQRSLAGGLPGAARSPIETALRPDVRHDGGTDRLALAIRGCGSAGARRSVRRPCAGCGIRWRARRRALGPALRRSAAGGPVCRARRVRGDASRGFRRRCATAFAAGLALAKIAARRGRRDASSRIRRGPPPIQDYARSSWRRACSRRGDAAGARAAAVRAVDGAPEGRPMPSVLLAGGRRPVERGRRCRGGGALPAVPRAVSRTMPSAARPVSRSDQPLGAGRVPRGRHACSASCGSLAPASPLRRTRPRVSSGSSARAASAAWRPRRRSASSARSDCSARGPVDTARSEAEALLDAKPPADLAVRRPARSWPNAARRAGRIDAAIRRREPGARRAARRSPRAVAARARAASAQEEPRPGARRARPARARVPEEPGAAEALGLKARILESAGAFRDAEAVVPEARRRAIRIRKRAAQRPGGWAGSSWFRGAHGRGGGALGPAGRGARRTGASRGRRVLDRARARAERRRRRGRASVRAGAGRGAAELLRDPRRRGAVPRRRPPRPPDLALPAGRAASRSRATIRASPASRRFARSGSRACRRGAGRARAPLARRAASGSTRCRRSTRRTRATIWRCASSAATSSRTRGAGSRACRARSGRCSTRSAGAPSSRSAAGRAVIDPSCRRGGARGVLVPSAGALARRRARADAAHAGHRAALAQARRLPFNDGDLLDDPGRQSRHGHGVSCRAPARVRRPAAGRRRVQCRADPRARVVGGAPLRRSRGLGRADPVQRDARVRQAGDAVVGRVPAPLRRRDVGGAAAGAGPAAASRDRPDDGRLWRPRGRRRLDAAIGALVWLWSAMCIVVGVWGFRGRPSTRDAALLLVGRPGLGVACTSSITSLRRRLRPDPGAHGARDRRGATRRRGRRLWPRAPAMARRVHLDRDARPGRPRRARHARAAGLADWLAGTGSSARAAEKAHLLRWRPRQPARRRATTPRRLPSGPPRSWTFSSRRRGLASGSGHRGGGSSCPT